MQKNSFIINQSLLIHLLEAFEKNYDIKIIHPLSKSLEKTLISKCVTVKRSWFKQNGGKMRNLFKQQNKGKFYKIVIESSSFISNFEHFSNLEDEVRSLRQKVIEKDLKINFLEKQILRKA